MHAPLRPAILMLPFAMAACGGPQADSKTAEPVLAAEKVEVVEEQTQPATEETADCSNTAAGIPNWALREVAPVPTKSNFSGMWISIAHDSSTSGTVTQVMGCYRAIKVLTVQQDGAQVKAAWVFKKATGGAEMVEWSRQHESAAGQKSGTNLNLMGAHLRVRGYGDTETSRDCTKVSYRLRWDAQTQNLLGTRNGEPIRLAPLALKKRTAPCGPPPP